MSAAGVKCHARRRRRPAPVTTTAAVAATSAATAASVTGGRVNRMSIQDPFLVGRRKECRKVDEPTGDAADEQCVPTDEHLGVGRPVLRGTLGCARPVRCVPSDSRQTMAAPAASTRGDARVPVDRHPSGRRRPGPGPRRRRFAMVSGNVFALGTVSLITDVSSEMVTAVLPLYLVLGLQLSPLAFGVLDGVYTGVTALLRLVGGYARRPVPAGASWSPASATASPRCASSACCSPAARSPRSARSSPSTAPARACAPPRATR